MVHSPPQTLEWRTQVGDSSYLISSTQSLLEHHFINDAFATDDMYWAKRISPEELRLMLSQSQVLGLYKEHNVEASAEPSSPRTPSPTMGELEEPQPELEMVGITHFITDYVSTTFLTDVYISPAYRRVGLRDWLVECCNEVIHNMPSLRRAFLMASISKGKPYFREKLGMWDVVEEKASLACMTRKTFEAPAP